MSSLSSTRANIGSLVTLEEELILFPQAEHDDLFDGLQTMMEGAVENHGFGVEIFLASDDDYSGDPWSWGGVSTGADWGRRW